MTQRMRWAKAVLRFLRRSPKGSSASCQVSCDPSCSEPVNHLIERALTLTPHKEYDQSQGPLNH